jgi:hypothetical protein
MGRYELVQYEPVHAYSILERNVREHDLWLSKYPDWDKWAEGWKTNGPAFTLLCDGEIIASGGVVLLGWQRGEAWLLLPSTFYSHVKACYRLIKEKLIEIQHANALRRIQALVDPDFEAAQRLMEHLGFQNEGRLKQYGPRGEDLLMYGRAF